MGEDKKPTTPQDIILTAIYSADKVETSRVRLVKWCKELIEWSQEKISVMKKEVADIETASDIGSRSVIQLTDIYKLMYSAFYQFCNLNISYSTYFMRRFIKINRENLDIISSSNFLFTY